VGHLFWALLVAVHFRLKNVDIRALSEFAQRHDSERSKHMSMSLLYHKGMILEPHIQYRSGKDPNYDKIMLNPELLRVQNKNKEEIE
jgi:hypothetical protein